MALRNMHSFVRVGVLVLCLTSASPLAHADLSVSALVGGAPTGVTYTNFENLHVNGIGGTPDQTSTSSPTMLNVRGNVGVSYTGNAGAVHGSVSGVYAAPYLSNGNGLLFGNNAISGQDATTFLSTGTGSVTLTLPGQEMYIGLLWGSVDSFNRLTFYNGSTSDPNNIVGSLTGSDVTASANGDQSANGTFYVNINSTVRFTSVVASSTSYAFEFDNVAFNATAVSVPEPSTFVVAAFGAMGLIAYALRRKGLAVIGL
jgi:PEP-CTERM motif